MKMFSTWALAATISLTAVAAWAEDYRASTFTPAPETHAKSMAWMVDELKTRTDGDITFELFVGGALIPAKSTMQGVADGVAQVGFVYTGYLPSELPLSNALSGMAFLESDPIVLALAYADWAMNDAQGYQEFRKNGVVPVGGIGSAPGDLVCNSAPIESISDLQGKRIRVPGGLISQFVKDMGATPVAIPSSEQYQALQTGQVDCVFITPSQLNIDGNLGEVAKSVLHLSMYSSFASPTEVFDVEFWQGLTDNQRRTVLDVAAEQLAMLEVGYLTPLPEALRLAEESGIVVVDPDSTIKDAIAKWIANGVGGMNEIAKSDFGIEDPEAFYAGFSSYLEKWRPLVAGMRNRLDQTELSALIKANLTDPIDVSKFGMD